MISPLIGTNPLSLQIPLPLGISFITFTMIAYVVDAFKGKFPVQRNPKALMGYVTFFPHLIAGPILRPNELMPQFDKLRKPMDAPFILGAAIFTVGLVRKLVFADQLAPYVNKVYDAPHNLFLEDYWMAFYGFSIQIYSDFSGYTSMAIGAAIILNINLPDNFMRPYGASSLVEFWARWHITLSHWLRDYLYFPLGGSRASWGRHMGNLMATMILGGLWHGAGWTFIIWGGLHGAGIVICHIIRDMKWKRFLKIIPTWAWVIITFHFVSFAWVFFRAPDMDTAYIILNGLAYAPLGNLPKFLDNMAFPLFLFAVFLIWHRWDDHRYIRHFVRQSPKALVVTLSLAAVFLSFILSEGSSKDFIYFDF